MTTLTRRRFVKAGGAAASAGALGGLTACGREDAAQNLPPDIARLTGAYFTAAWRAPVGPPAIRAIPIPEFPGSGALWGATGRDAQGGIWFGVSAVAVAQPSARLFRYDPSQDLVEAHGDVVTALREAGVFRNGEQQAKIHSRIVPGADGNLYFASSDEAGEVESLQRPPDWGGHLWRLDPERGRWTHLAAMREALIACAGAGRWIYALGYFNHALYQYDLETERLSSIVVGAAGGHASRNFFADHRGHVFVPRVAETADGGLAVALAEFDPDLREVGATPLDNYTLTRDSTSHGITAVQHLMDYTIVFMTDQGFLYRATPRLGAPARIEPMGYFHPAGAVYSGSLFSSDGATHLMGLVQARGGYDWTVYDLRTGLSDTYTVEMPELDAEPVEPLIYGSMTRDNDGACYLAAAWRNSRGWRPGLLRVSAAT